MLSFLRNVSTIKLVRIALGILLIIQSAFTHDILLGIAGLIFVLMAITNKGCCYADRPNKKNNDSPKEIKYEEVV